jgi:2-polyprenyl-6-methoxyphenol hydroxylase-like FAD-dependent oxidoreductase
LQGAWLKRFPRDFLVLGDAISSFNPIYGQGMSVACLEAEQLDRILGERPAVLSRRFFARVAKVVDNPWSIAVGNDLRMPEAVGPRHAGVNLVNWYMARLHRAAHRDAELSKSFHLVSNLLAPPPSVMHPRLAARVLWRSLGG